VGCTVMETDARRVFVARNSATIKLNNVYVKFPNSPTGNHFGNFWLCSKSGTSQTHFLFRTETALKTDPLCAYSVGLGHTEQRS
jgi:hypothetical protein